MIIAAYVAKNTLPLSKRSGAAVFHSRQAFTAWRKYGYGKGQIARHGEAGIGIVVIDSTDSAQPRWSGLLTEFLENTAIFGGK